MLVACIDTFALVFVMLMILQSLGCLLLLFGVLIRMHEPHMSSKVLGKTFIYWPGQK